MKTALALGGLAFAAAAASLPTAVDLHRQLGKGCYENDDFKSAAEHLRRVLRLAPDSAVDHLNLGLVLMRATDYTNALAALDRAEQLDAGLLGAHYLRGIIFKRLADYPRAIASLERVVAGDPDCVGAYYNLAMCQKAAEQPTNAIATLRAALERGPNNPSCHYQLITLYRRVGQVENAARHAEIFDRLKDTVDEAEKTPEALERSRYSYYAEVPAVGPDLEPAPEPPGPFVAFTAAAGLAPPTPPAALPPLPSLELRREDFTLDIARHYLAWNSGAVAIGDYDDDGRPDIYLVNAGPGGSEGVNRLYRNEGGGRFADVTSRAGVGGAGSGTDAVWGDFDNDRRLDLYVVRAGPNVLYRNRGDGTFEDLSAAARVNEPQNGVRAEFVDYDHDNDLDLLVANGADLADPPGPGRFRLPDDFPGQTSALLRNNGNGTFTDQTDEAGLLVNATQTRDLVCADFDADHDIDILAVNAGAPSLLFLNQRLGKFAVGGSFTPPLASGGRAAAEADFNRDGRPDLVVAVGTNLVLYRNEGLARFRAVGEPGAGLSSEVLAAGSRVRIRVLDVNNDGWPDVLWTDGFRLGLLAGAGLEKFRKVTVASGLEGMARENPLIADVAAADVDGDGDLDLMVQTRDRGPVALRNDGAVSRHWLAVRLAGKKVNALGYGATVEIVAGGHYQKQTVRHDTVHFGLGSRTNVEVVRVTWPNGMAQNVLEPAAGCRLEIEEYVKVSASCAFLWADGGQGYRLVNEILGVGPLGVPRSAREFFPPDCTELTKIEADQLVARDGRYELRLTEDLRELAYLDQVELRVVDHPAELEVIPNEMFTDPPFPEDKFYAVPAPRAPRSAIDDRGRDVLDQVRYRDGRYPPVPRTAHDGLAEPHSLTLDLGNLADARQILLCLDGWIYWADSSVSWGIFQNPGVAVAPLKLEVRDAGGRWQTAIASVGLPTSKGLVVPVDLTGRFPAPDWHVRLSTTLCLYFDRIFVATRDDAARCRTTVLPVAEADLRYRGFARLERDEFGYERFDYDSVTPFGSWNPPRGHLTRHGDVTPLLGRADDRFVVIGPGDGVAMRFKAQSLPALPAGWQRSFVFYANGWVKDGDLNTKFSETVEPLPFHGMSGYPYGPGEHYPDDATHREYLRTYQTRPSRPTVGVLTRHDH